MTLNQNWELQVDKNVLKSLEKIPKTHAQKITTLLEVLPLNPFAGDVKKIQGEDTVWRRRVGEYRIIFNLYKEQKVIYIFSISRRNTNTY